MFSYITLEQRIPDDHPARQIRALVDRALAGMDADFAELYSHTGRPSVAPERLLRASLLMVLYSIRSERQLIEQLHYNLLYRWFVGLEMDDPVWDVTVFTKNRERLIAGAASQRLLESVLVEAEDKQLLSEEHFTVDGTLIQAWAAARSFVEKKEPPKPGAATVAEREMAIALVDRVIAPVQDRPAEKKITLGADTQYQEEKFIQALRQRQIAPHVSEYTRGQNMAKNSLNQAERADERRTISQRKRKLIERVFGWSKLDRMLRQVKVRGLARVDWFYRLTIAAYNLVRMRRLIAIEAPAC